MRPACFLIYALCAASAFAQTPQITGYEHDGTLTFESSSPGKLFSLEFTHDLENGTWTNWGSVTDQPITGAVMNLPTPMFFRIKESEPGVVTDPSVNAYFVAHGLDYNHNNRIDAEEADTLTYLNLGASEASPLYWRELDTSAFVNLERINLSVLPVLTNLVFGTHSNLVSLILIDTHMRSLDLSGLPYLEEIGVRFAGVSSDLTTINLSGLSRVRHLACPVNSLSELDLSDLNALETLSCYGNQLTTLDIHSNTNLETLSCYNNQLTTLDIHSNTNLNSVRATGNPLTEIIVWDTNSLPASFWYDGNPVIREP